MADVKWIKITTDMFDNKKIKYLRTLPEGDSIVLIWVMLLTMAGRCNANGMIFLTENIPYTPKMLADELGFSENVVLLAIEALSRVGMIIKDNDFFVISGWEEHQNIEGLEKIREQNRIRKQKQRERERARLEDKTSLLELSHDMSRDVTQQNKNKKESKKEKDNKKHIVQTESARSVRKSEIDDLFERVWKLYPSKKGKGQVKDAQKKRLFDIGYEELERAITRYKKELEKDSDWRKPQNGSTFFNSGYVDYLDANYEGQQQTENQSTKKSSRTDWGDGALDLFGKDAYMLDN